MSTVFVWLLLLEPDVEQMLAMHREEGRDLMFAVAHTGLSCYISCSRVVRQLINCCQLVTSRCRN